LTPSVLTTLAHENKISSETIKFLRFLLFFCIFLFFNPLDESLNYYFKALQPPPKTQTLKRGKEGEGGRDGDSRGICLSQIT
jgi:hypothetical protein